MISEITNIFISVLLPIFAVVGIAALIGSYINLDEKTLSRLVLYLFLPFLVVTSLVEMKTNYEEIGLYFLVGFLSSLILILIGWLISKVFHVPTQTQGAFILCMFVGNTGTIGFPLCEFLFGEAGLQRAVLFYAVTSIITFTIGIYVISLGQLSIKQSISNIFKMPVLYALIIGLTMNIGQFSLPLPLERFAKLLGQATVPCVLVVMGLQLSKIRFKGNYRLIISTSVMRILAATLTAFALVEIIGVLGLNRQVIILEISMPTALFAAVLATEFNSDGEFAAGVTMVTTLLSIFSLTLLILFLM